MTLIEYSYIFKFIILGDPGIGKSSILYSYTTDRFNEEMISTIGIEYGSKLIDLEVEHNGKLYNTCVKVQIWDTAGQERYQTVTTAYYRGSVGVFLVYDITSRETFQHIRKWYDRFIDKNSNHNTTKFTIIGNKSDMNGKRKVLYSEGKELADKMGADFYETSCKKGSSNNIKESFEGMAKKVYCMALDHNKRDINGIRKSDIEELKILDSSKRRCC